MYSQEVLYFIILSVIVLFAQFMPTGILLVLDNIAVRIGIVVLLLYFIAMGPTAGIFGLLAIGALYLERNRRKMASAVKKLDAMEARSRPATVDEAGTPQTTVPVRDFDVPEMQEADFLPHETCDSADFETVAPSINQKAVLSTVYPLQAEMGSAAAAESLFEQMGFGHVAGVETHGETQ